MLRKLLVVLGLAALATVPLQAQVSTDMGKTINDLEAQWGASIMAGNWAAVESFLTPDFVFTDGAGKRTDRATYITGLRDSDTPVSNLQVGPYTVLVNGNTAVHLGEATWTQTDKKGTVKKFHEIWTDTWVLQANGMWLCMAAQSVNLPVK
jgi:ketosteroid isomerase-like protein